MGIQIFTPIMPMGVFYCLFMEFLFIKRYKMKKKNLAGCKFSDKDGRLFTVLSGYENDAIVFEEYSTDNAPLGFCCDAYIENGRLYGSYHVNYSVSKSEFFSCIEDCNDFSKILSQLKSRYYKIPRAFLALVCEIFINERKSV